MAERKRIHERRISRDKYVIAVTLLFASTLVGTILRGWVAETAVAGVALGFMVGFVLAWEAADVGHAAMIDAANERAEAAALRSIEARNPGIDMDEVRRIRAGGS